MTTYERPFGRYFEEFEVGDVYRHWPGKTITEDDDHLFCMITMNHHPLHTNAWFAEHETVQGRNVVVGNLVYSLVLGMSVPDVSGSAIANLEVESLLHGTRRSTATPSTPRPGCSTRCESRSKRRPRHRDRRDQGVQPAGRGGLLLPPQGHGVEARLRPAPAAPLRRRRLGLTAAPGRDGLRSPPSCAGGWPTAGTCPWRRTRDPWHILSSEVMLQQTQAHRVIEPYRRWVERFPTPPPAPGPDPPRRCGRWAGLGYNGRAVRLHQAAVAVVEQHGGQVPDRLDLLEALPGVGPYTARAVLAFAFERARAGSSTPTWPGSFAAPPQAGGSRDRSARRSPTAWCRSVNRGPTTRPSSMSASPTAGPATHAATTAHCTTSPRGGCAASKPRTLPLRRRGRVGSTDRTARGGGGSSMPCGPARSRPTAWPPSVVGPTIRPALDGRPNSSCARGWPAGRLTGRSACPDPQPPGGGSVVVELVVVEVLVQRLESRPPIAIEDRGGASWIQREEPVLDHSSRTSRHGDASGRARRADPMRDRGAKTMPGRRTRSAGFVTVDSGNRLWPNTLEAR